MTVEYSTLSDVADQLLRAGNPDVEQWEVITCSLPDPSLLRLRRTVLALMNAITVEIAKRVDV